MAHRRLPVIFTCSTSRGLWPTVPRPTLTVTSNKLPAISGMPKNCQRFMNMWTLIGHHGSSRIESESTSFAAMKAHWKNCHVTHRPSCCLSWPLLSASNSRAVCTTVLSRNSHTCGLQETRKKPKPMIRSFYNNTHFTSSSKLLVQNYLSRGFKSDGASDSFVNPLLELQKFVSVPILSEQQAVFNPSDAEVAEAVSVFRNPGRKPSNAVTFVGSFVDGSKLPDYDMPEVCFLGRSNVGKSSLISTLLYAHEIRVDISDKPGRTKSLNFYHVGRHFTLVDMPGYGQNMPRHFQSSVETYLQTRRRLCRTFLLVDGNVGLTSTDRTALDMLQELGIPYVVVLTKIDKAGRHKVLRNLLSVMEVCGESAGHNFFSQSFLVSSKTGDGLMLLQTFIAYITGCVKIKGL